MYIFHKVRQDILKYWLEYATTANARYINSIDSFFQQWKRFTQHINLRSPLITITDSDIWIVEKIFKQIKNAQSTRSCSI